MLAVESGEQGKFATISAMLSLYSDQVSAQMVADLHRELFAPLGQGARTSESFERAPLAGRRIKLGLAKRIDADGIDLLLDLVGHTGEQRLALFRTH